MGRIPKIRIGHFILKWEQIQQRPREMMQRIVAPPERDPTKPRVITIKGAIHGVFRTGIFGGRILLEYICHPRKQADAFQIANSSPWDIKTDGRNPPALLVSLKSCG